MKLGKFGVFVFTDQLDGMQLAECARRVEEFGYSTLWYPEVGRYESFVEAAYLLSNSTDLVVGSGIANIYARDPAASVMGHNSLNELYGGRFVLGLGVSHAPLVSTLRGHDYKRPVSTMRKYLDDMDAVWQSLAADPADKQVILAALGPNMSKLAAERTLGAFPYNVTPKQIAMSKEAMGGKGVIVCEQKICMCSDPATARKVAREALEFYLPLRNYNNNWFRLGFEESDLANGGSDRLLDAMVMWGDAERIRDGLQAYVEAGVDQLVIQPLRPDGLPGPDYAALEELAE